MNITGDGSLAKLRAVSTEDLLKAATRVRLAVGGMLGIDIDGWVLPESPANVFAEGHEHKVALLFGNNSQELQRPFGGAAVNLRESISQYLAPWPIALSRCTDSTEPPILNPIQSLEMPERSGPPTPHSAAPRFRNFPGTPRPGILPTSISSQSPYTEESEGAPHAAEIPFVFGTLPVWQQMRGYTLSDRQYAPVIQEYWVNFAKTGDPNGAGLVKWPRFDPGARAYLDLMDAGPVAKEGLRRPICDLFMENQTRRATQ